MGAYIVLLVMLLMIILFVLNRWPFGVVTMSCCAILGITGVLKPAEVFSGLANPFVVMLAGCFVITSAFARTSFIAVVKEKIVRMQEGKSGALLMTIFVGAVILLATFMPGPSLLAILIVMAGNLEEKGEVNAARVILPAAALTTLWNGRIPIGIGAGNFAVLNGFLEAGSEYQVKMWDPMLAGLFPGIGLAIYTILCYKLLPHKEANKASIAETAAKEKEKQAAGKMSHRDEVLTYIAFIAMLAVMILNHWTGNLMYVGPACIALILIYLKVVTPQEAVKAATVDLIWMLAGIFTLTAALTSSGAGTLIGDAIIAVFGDTVSNQLGLVMLFGGITIVLTNFMSNNASMYSIMPVAITAALAGGVNPVPVMLTIDVAAKCSMLLPCSSGESAMCYGASGYSPKETWKFTIPGIILYYVLMVVGIMIIF